MQRQVIALLEGIALFWGSFLIRTVSSWVNHFAWVPLIISGHICAAMSSVTSSSRLNTCQLQLEIKLEKNIHKIIR